MGGFEILVPDTWNVIVEATPFLGGVDVKARTSLNPSAPASHRAWVRDDGRRWTSRTKPQTI